VACTWGEGPDVLVYDRDPFAEAKWTDLTVAQARILAGRLLEAADKAESLERGYAAAVSETPLPSHF
jgi:hypothetical protein